MSFPPKIFPKQPGRIPGVSAVGCTHVGISQAVEPTWTAEGYTIPVRHLCSRHLWHTARYCLDVIEGRREPKNVTPGKTFKVVDHVSARASALKEIAARQLTYPPEFPDDLSGRELDFVFQFPKARWMLLDHSSIFIGCETPIEIHRYALRRYDVP